MTPNIPEQVARNRQDVTRLDGQFVESPDQQQQNLKFDRNTIAITVSVEVYTRPLNEMLISGHPNGSVHGSGHGVSGATRGTWSMVNAVEQSSTWVRGGRNSVRDALDGQPTGSIGGTAVGTGTDAAQGTDDALTARTGSTFAYGLKDNPDEVRARSHYLFQEAGLGGPDLTEFGLESAGGVLMGRIVTDPVNQDLEEELRVDITATVEGAGGGGGSSVLTNAGRATVADSIQSEGTVAGLAEIAWGTGSPTLDPTTTSLANEVFRKDAERTLALETLTVSRPQFQFEPSGQPYEYTEVGVFDDSGDLFWLVGFTDSPFPKDSQDQFTTQIQFRIE